MTSVTSSWALAARTARSRRRREPGRDGPVLRGGELALEDPAPRQEHQGDQWDVRQVQDQRDQQPAVAGPRERPVSGPRCQQSQEHCERAGAHRHPLEAAGQPGQLAHEPGVGRPSRLRQGHVSADGPRHEPERDQDVQRHHPFAHGRMVRPSDRLGMPSEGRHARRSRGAEPPEDLKQRQPAGGPDQIPQFVGILS